MLLNNNSVIAITGAASGIGRALAKRAAERGVAGVAIADVNESGLNETADIVRQAGGKVSVHVVDVSNFDQVQQFADEVVAEHGKVTHIVNNAGVGVMGTFEQLSIADIEWLMGINYWGVVYGCKAFLAKFREQGSGHIINISSVFGLIAPEEQSAYCSSKFAVRGFTESLKHELAGSGIDVSCVHPGGILTEIARNSRLGQDTPAEWKAQGAKFFDKVAKTSPDTAADVIIDGINSGEVRILIGKDAKAMNLIVRLFPRKYLRVLEKLSGHKLSLRKK